MYTVKVPVLVPTLRAEIEMMLDALVSHKDSLSFDVTEESEEGKSRHMAQNLIFAMEGLLSRFDKVESEMLEHSNRV